MSVLIRGVRLYGEGEPVDVLVSDAQIAEIGPQLAIPDDADVVDATGQILLPGFVGRCRPIVVGRAGKEQRK